jgi:hypothetical protein
MHRRFIAILLCLLGLGGCTQKEFPTAELVANSLNQRWYQLVIDREYPDEFLGLLVDDGTVAHHGGGVTCPPPGRYPVMVAKQQDGTYRWYIKTKNGSGHGGYNRLADIDLNVSALNSNTTIALGEPVIATGTDSASMDTIDPGSYHISFNVSSAKRESANNE